MSFSFNVRISQSIKLFDDYIGFPRAGQHNWKEEPIFLYQYHENDKHWGIFWRMWELLLNYPLVNCHITNWKDPPIFHGKTHYFYSIFNGKTHYFYSTFNGKTHYKLPFSSSLLLVITRPGNHWTGTMFHHVPSCSTLKALASTGPLGFPQTSDVLKGTKRKPRK
jgi:hypothetical protein